MGGTSLNQLFRLRLATVDFAWKNTTFTVGQDKPLMAPREPDSLAQVGVSPLTGAGKPMALAAPGAHRAALPVQRIHSGPALRPAWSRPVSH